MGQNPRYPCRLPQNSWQTDVHPIYWAHRFQPILKCAMVMVYGLWMLVAIPPPFESPLMNDHLSKVFLVPLDGQKTVYSFKKKQKMH